MYPVNVINAHLENDIYTCIGDGIKLPLTSHKKSRHHGLAECAGEAIELSMGIAEDRNDMNVCCDLGKEDVLKSISS